MKTQVLVSAEKTKEAIRCELQVYFPRTQFQIVAKQKAGMSTSIIISYEDGPRSPDVRKIVKGFEYGSYSSGGSKHISIDVERQMSDSTEQSLIHETGRLLGISNPLKQTDFLPAFNKTVGDYIRQIFCVMTF